MNKDRLSELLHEPALVAQGDLAGLRELKQRYPWFSGAHLLLAMGEHAVGEVLFDDTLRTTAAHVPSREALLAMVEGTHSEPPALKTLSGIKVAGSEGVAEAPAPGPHQPVPNEIAQRLLDLQIRDAAIVSAYVPEALHAEEKPDASVVGLRSAPAGIEAPPPEPSRATISTPPDDLTPRSFTSWLDQASASAAPAVPFDNEAVRAASTQDWLRTTPEVTPRTDKPASTPILTRDLIDRFLEQSTPQPKKTGFFNPQQAAKQSFEEHLDIVTETLARIHEKQGHWAKAAEAYQRLAQKHPQKSGYFAALAEKALRNLNT